MRDRERFPRVTIDELDEDGLALRQAILSGPRSQAPGQFPIEAEDSTLEGPFGIFLFSPAIGAPFQELGARLRSQSSLSDRDRELATLAVGAVLRCGFEIQAHVPLALRAGLTRDEVDSIIAGQVPADPAEAALVTFCRANARDTTPLREFEELARHLDKRALFEVTALVAYYRGLATMLEMFAISPPLGSEAPQIATVRPTRGSPDLEAGVAQLLEEREISRVLTALARCVDTFDFDGLAELYAEDGELVTPWSSHRGREGLAEHVRREIGVYQALHHVSAGHEIYVTPGASVARARMTLLATHVSDDAGSVFTTTGGHYEIELVREHGAWRLRRNQIFPSWNLESKGLPGEGR